MNGPIPIPGQLERFIRLEAEASKPNEIRFIKLESVIGMFLTELFSGFDIKSQGAFRGARQRYELQEEAEDLVRSYESQLKRRGRGSAIRLESKRGCRNACGNSSSANSEFAEESVFVKDGILALADTSQLIVSDRPDLLFKPFNIRFPKRIREFSGDCFAAVRNRTS